MSRPRWKLGVLGAFAAGILLAPTLVAASPAATRTAPLSASAAASGVVVHKVSASTQAAARQYWTKQRMANAKSMDIEAPASARSGSGSPVASATGSPGVVPPVTRSGKAVNSALAATGAEPVPQDFAYPYPFTRTAVKPTSMYKHSSRRQNGKIFFTQNGGNFVCSGTVVTSTNRNEVWTAGHCLSDGSQTFNSSTIFVPAYNGVAATPAPYGRWTATQLVVSTDWHNTGNFRTDLGAFNVAPINGIQIQNRIGAAGFAWNQSRNQQFTSHAYPQAAPFNGNSMQLCMAAFGNLDTRIGGAGATPTGIGCDFTGGSSGGSWQIRWGGTTGNSAGLINGHNDYKWSDQPLAMYSPYFDTLANQVRCAIQPPASNGCP